jgi:hypothetical protein
MDLSESNRCLDRSDPEFVHFSGKVRVVRGIVGFIFLLIGTGMTTAHWLASERDAATPGIAQRQAAVGPDAMFVYFPTQYANQAANIEPHIETF